MELLKSARVRVTSSSEGIATTVSRILGDIRRDGLHAVKRYARELDGYVRDDFQLSRADIDAAFSAVSTQAVEDITFAQRQVRLFAERQREALSDLEVEMHPGIILGHRNIPVDSVACYVPGGRYPLLASAHMGIVTARVAGVRRIVALTPPNQGKPHPETIVAMILAGADEIHLIGGAHGLAAAAFGAGGLRPVDMIVGPGNAYVAEAKRQLFGHVGIDLLAGPTEVLVIADEGADAETVAADLLGQAEHGPDSVPVLITTSRDLADRVTTEIEHQLQTLETAAIARAAWENHGEILLAADEDEVVQAANEIASEHVQVMTEQPERYLARLTNYGALFLGEMTNVSFGDKVIGTNHILPTSQAARYTGGLWVGKFLKTCTYQRITRPDAAAMMGRYGSRLCALENFAGHKRQADLRVERFGGEPPSPWRAVGR